LKDEDLLEVLNLVQNEIETLWTSHAQEICCAQMFTPEIPTEEKLVPNQENNPQNPKNWGEELK